MLAIVIVTDLIYKVTAIFIALFVGICSVIRQLSYQNCFLSLVWSFVCAFLPVIIGSSGVMFSVLAPQRCDVLLAVCWAVYRQNICLWNDVMCSIVYIIYINSLTLWQKLRNAELMLRWICFQHWLGFLRVVFKIMFSGFYGAAVHILS